MSFASGAKAFASLRGAGALAAKAHISRSEEQFAVVAPRSEIEQSLQAQEHSWHASGIAGARSTLYAIDATKKGQSKRRQ